jgi:hypothetical protein
MITIDKWKTITQDGKKQLETKKHIKKILQSRKQNCNIPVWQHHLLLIF